MRFNIRKAGQKLCLTIVAIISGGLCASLTPSAQAQTNVLITPGFEGLAVGNIADNGGVNQWGNYNDTAGNCVVETGIVHGGTSALEFNVNPTGSQGNSIIYQNTGSSVPSNVVQNTKWYYSFWVYTPVSSSGSFTWAFFPSDSFNEDQTGASASIVASSLTPATWTQVSGSFTTGTYAFNASATQEMKATFTQANSTATFYLDDVTLTTNANGGSGGGTTNNPPATAGNGVTVTVDPSVALTNYTSLGEWNTDGVFDNWTTTQVTGATVAGGILSGTAGSTNPEVALSGIAGGPDLDLAFNDYVDVRLQVPAGFAGGIQVYFGAANNYYGTSNSTTGFSASRVFNITNAPADGAFHVYRVFFGPHIYWRGNLSDVRVDPLGTTATVGQAFALDYVRVGDLAGDIYLPSYDAANVPGPGTNDPIGYPLMDMSSKHFRFCWDASVTSNSFWRTNMAHGTLRNFEEVWKHHVWTMGYIEPSRPLGTTVPYSGKKYKVNISTWNGGYWTGADGNKIPWVNITPDGLQVDPPTWVPPHEFTHACQEDGYTNGSQNVDGQFWENNANYAREQWLYFYPWNTNQSGLDPYYGDTSHFWLAHGRDYYLCWPFWLYLDENPDNLPGFGSSYGNFFTPKLWQSEPTGEYLWSTLARLSPSNSVQDIIGYMARRNVVWDYSHRTQLAAAANTGDAELNQRWTYAELRQRPDDPTWWQTPIEFAPQQGGYKIHKLTPQGSGAGRVVTVNFHGLADSSRGADWRACLVVVSNTGTVRYSSLWNAGSNSVTLAANENTVYLVVAGTPATPWLLESIDETAEDYQSSLAKVRFPYEIQVTGAAPYETPAGSTSGLVQVANGGGWRSTTATVDATAYVGPNARVLNTAKVRGNARILDYAIVENSAVVSNNAVVSGHALVRNTALVKDNAKVRDYAMVIDNSVVGGNSRVLQHGEITQGSIITDWATVKGTVATWRDTTVATNPQAWNDAVLDGDFSTAQSCSNGFQFGFEEYNAGPTIWITNRTSPRRLYAAYEFNSSHDSLAKDLLGVTDGYLQGSPTWVAWDGQRPGFLTFNGANQYVILDRSLSDLREITVTAWVKWSGGAASQPAWYFGGGTTTCMYLTPSDGSGHASFVMINGTANQTLSWSSPLPVGVWTHVSVTLSNGVAGRLYINGTNVDTESITLTPDQLNAANANTTPQQNYLARGTGNSLPFFKGALDSVHVYTGPLTDVEVAALQTPPTVTGTGTLYVDLRATNAASGVSPYTTWTNFGSTVGNFTRSGAVIYSTNVAGTGIPGLLFNGTSTLYASAVMSVADILGTSDRTIEVWAYNPALATEETMVSLGDRSGTRKDVAFNFGNAAGWGAVTHLGDDVPWGAMGFPATNYWHHLVYVFDGNRTVTIYADGQLWYTDHLGGALVTPGADPINVGCQRASAAGGGPGQYFSGYINSVRIWGGAMTAAQVQSNFQFGPWILPGTQAISFAAISNVTTSAGRTVTVTASATDPDQPPLPLSYSLLAAPAGAGINATNGVFTWRPSVTQAGTSNLITIQAANNGTPGLSASQNFTATVLPMNAPGVGGVSLTNGQLQISVNGDFGPDYSISTSSNLTDWITIFTTNQPAVPFMWADTNLNQPQLFYRVQVGP